MPSPRTALILTLLLLMEVLAGFTVVVGSSLIDAIDLGYGMFWLFLLEALIGVAVVVAVGTIGAGRRMRLTSRRKRLLLLLPGVVSAALLGWWPSSNNVSLVAAALLLFVAYWRGLGIAQEPPVYREVQRRFGVGYAVLFAGIVWIVARGIIFERPIWHMVALLGIAYTVTGMAALMTARLEARHEPGALQAVVLAVAVQLVLLAVVGVAALALFAHDIGAWLFSLTRPFWDLVGPVWGRFLELLFTPISALLQLIHAHQHNAHPLRPPRRQGGNNTPIKRLKSHPESGLPVTIAALILLVLFLAGIGALIWKTLPHLHLPQRETPYKEERRSLWSFAALWQALVAWLRSLIHKGAEVAGEAGQAARRRLLGPVLPEDPVRRVYAQLLWRAQAVGLPRPAGVTPLEYQTSLAARWPDGSSDFAALTDAYVRRRYGDAGFDEAQLARLRQSWHHVRPLMRRPPRPAPQPTTGTATTAAVAAPPASGFRSWLSRRRDPLRARQSVLGLIGYEVSSAVLAMAALVVIILVLTFAAILLTQQKTGHRGSMPAVRTLTPSPSPTSGRGEPWQEAVVIMVRVDYGRETIAGRTAAEEPQSVPWAAAGRSDRAAAVGAASTGVSAQANAQRMVVVAGAASGTGRWREVPEAAYDWPICCRLLLS